MCCIQLHSTLNFRKSVRPNSRGVCPLSINHPHWLLSNRWFSEVKYQYRICNLRMLCNVIIRVIFNFIVKLHWVFHLTSLFSLLVVMLRFWPQTPHSYHIFVSWNHLYNILKMCIPCLLFLLFLIFDNRIFTWKPPAYCLSSVPKFQASY